MAARKKKADVLLVARQTATPKVDGEDYPMLARVTQVRSSDPVARQHPDLFAPVDGSD